MVERRLQSRQRAAAFLSGRALCGTFLAKAGLEGGETRFGHGEGSASCTSVISERFETAGINRKNRRKMASNLQNKKPMSAPPCRRQVWVTVGDRAVAVLQRGLSGMGQAEPPSLLSLLFLLDSSFLSALLRCSPPPRSLLLQRGLEQGWFGKIMVVGSRRGLDFHKRQRGRALDCNSNSGFSQLVWTTIYRC